MKDSLLIDTGYQEESIVDFQKNSLFVRQVSDLFEEVLGKSRKEIFEAKFDSRLAELIRFHTKLKNSHVGIGDESGESNDFSMISVATDVKNLVKIKNLKFSYDYATGFVSGDVDKINNFFLIPISWIIHNKFTAREFTALLMHEVAHVVFYIIFLARTIRTNLALEIIANDLKEGMSEKERIYVYRRALDASGTKSIHISDVSGIEDSNLATMIFVNSIQNDFSSELGTVEYDKTMMEYYCDMYAVRQGLGKDLATAMLKVQKIVNTFSFREAVEMAAGINVLTAAIASVLATSFIVPATAFSAFWLLVTAVVSQPVESDYSYDDTMTRIKRVRQQASKVFQDRNLSAKESEAIKNELSVIDEAIGKVEKENSPFNNFFAKLLSRSTRKRLSIQEVQNEYEELAYNKLFEKSSFLKNV